MINKGIIRNITDNEILVEPLNSDTPEGHSCGSGGCDHCSHQGKTRLMKINNPKNLIVRLGNLVEFEMPTSQALLGFFRTLLAPPLTFALFYFTASIFFNSSVSATLIAGAIGFSVAVTVNILYGRKATVTEIPNLVKVLN